VATGPRPADIETCAEVHRTGIIVVAVARIVPAGPRGGITGVDRTFVVVLAGGAGGLQRQCSVGRKAQSTADENHDGEHENKAQDMPTVVVLHEGPP